MQHRHCQLTQQVSRTQRCHFSGRNGEARSMLPQCLPQNSRTTYNRGARARGPEADFTRPRSRGLLMRPAISYSPPNHFLDVLKPTAEDLSLDLRCRQSSCIVCLFPACAVLPSEQDSMDTKHVSPKPRAVVDLTSEDAAECVGLLELLLLSANLDVQNSCKRLTRQQRKACEPHTQGSRRRPDR